MSAVASAADDFVSHAGGKVRGYVQDLANDPGRTIAALATAGGSEHLREMGIAVKEKIDDNVKAAQGPAAPTVKPPTTPAPAPGSATESLPDAAKDKGPDRGRASTILTGARGLEDEPMTARRTLLGV
jgi:hypothetical protein